MKLKKFKMISLRDMRFSWKVGGGFAATTLLTAVVGLVGTLSIVQFRDESGLNTKVTAVMARLQEVSAAQKEYLSSRTKEHAVSTLAGIGLLRDDLNTVAAELDASSAERASVVSAISMVDGLTDEFQNLVDSNKAQASQAERLSESANRLKEIAKQIVAEMQKSKAEATEKAVKDGENRDAADELNNVLSGVREQTLVMESEFSSFAAGDPFDPEFAKTMKERNEKALKNAENLAYQIEYASEITVEGIDPGMLQDLIKANEDFQSALKETIAKGPGSGSGQQDEHAQQAAKQVSDQVNTMRTAIYSIVQSIQEASAASREQLASVEKVAEGGSSLLQATLETQLATARFMSGSNAVTPVIMAGIFL